MFAFFVSIVILSAGVFSGLLFYIAPHTEGKQITGLSISEETLSPTQTPSPTQERQVTSLPSPTVVLLPSVPISLATTPSPTIPPFPTNSPSPTKYPTVTIQSSFPTPTTQSSFSVIAAQLTITPSITSFSTITPTPSPLTQQSSTGLNADIIFSLINTYRSQKGLPSFQKDDTTCSIAKSRAPEIYNEIFVTHTMGQGLRSQSYPYWLTENIINNDTETDAVNWWLNDTTHRQIIEGNYTNSCVSCDGYSCVQIFTSYVKK